jgi:hypothetical protein
LVRGSPNINKQGDDGRETTRCCESSENDEQKETGGMIGCGGRINDPMDARVAVAGRSDGVY